MSSFRIVVVDDHAMFRAGLVGLLEDMAEFEVVGEAANGRDAITIIRQTRPDVVLMDTNMPIMDGIEAVKALKKGDSCRIIMLTSSKQETDLIKAIKAGADGYLLRNLESDRLKKAILSVVSDKSDMTPKVNQPVLRAVKNTNPGILNRGISKRELEVLECLARGMTTPQIATQLYVSENTVKTHIRHILGKLEATNRSEAIHKATQLGLLRS